ncbi:MAG: hypothetical protein LBD22_00305 [Spirochaetaceae bacterium]|nr:hypothetical protein [Spirochaetaceae bacterium]
MVKRCVPVVILVICASCATGPREFSAYLSSPSAELRLFPRGAEYYISVDRTKNSVIYDTFFPAEELSDTTLRSIINNVKKITFAVYQNTPRQGVLAVLHGGGYPVFRSMFYFGFSSKWKKVVTKHGNYWQSKKENVTVALRRNVILIAFGDVMFEESGVIAPAIYDAFQSGAMAGGWTPKADFLNVFFAENDIPLNLPVTNIIFNLKSRKSHFELNFRLEMPGPAQAKLAASLITLMRRGLPPRETSEFQVADILLANPVQIDGNAVLITTAPFSAGDLRSFCERVLR